ncbi:MAG: hypothetical protein WC806_02065 [Candidatus Gracilibacteria bacterium]|jgi:hypothetical protein
MPLQLNAYNMRKFLPIIIGIFLGIASSSLMIILDNNLAFSEDANSAANPNDSLSGWEKFKSGLGEATTLLQARNIFGKIKGGPENVYYLVRAKVSESGNKKTLEILSQNYSYSIEELEAIVKGSIAPIVHNPNNKITFTQEEAYKLQSAMKADYDDLKDLFDLENDVSLTTMPIEIFSNGDLADSGFDLLYDLNVIEKILFLQSNDKPLLPGYKNAQDSAYNPDVEKPLKLLPTKDEIARNESPAGVNVDNEGNAFVPLDEENSIPAEIANEDICPEENTAAVANNDFKTQPKVPQAEVPADEDAKKAPKPLYEQKSPLKDKLAPAIPGEYKKSICPLFDENSTGAGGGSSIVSLKDMLTPNGEGLGAGAGFSAGGISAQVLICINIELIKKTVSSYNAGDSCIQCEIEKIVEILKKINNVSLIVNKTTGNIFETAKCSDSYKTLFSMNTILQAVPIPTPPQSNTVFGKNIFDEWNKFAQKTGWDNLKGTTVTTTFQPTDSTSDSLINGLAAETDKQSKDVQNLKLAMEIADEATNITSMAQSVLPELKLMSQYFENYKKQFDTSLKNACTQLQQKGNTDG